MGLSVCVEIMLRNAINTHYKQYFNDDNWIINQARPNGLLEQEASEIVRIQRTYTNMGVYNNDKMVASFTFGFWTYLFTRRNYRIGGKTLLQIFPNKAHGLKQTDIYKQLTAIREFRNRIAHHEPICFNATRAIDTKYAKEHYELIRTYIGIVVFCFCFDRSSRLVPSISAFRSPNLRFYISIRSFRPDFLSILYDRGVVPP